MRYTLLLILCLPHMVLANFTQSPAQGFHWYTTPKQIKSVPPPKAIRSVGVHRQESTLSPAMQLHVLSNATRNALDAALLNPSVANTTRYLRAQQFWARQDQRFVRSWQMALLQHPELDYRLYFPTNNTAIPIRNDERNLLLTRTLKDTAKHFGLVFFYRGHSTVCKRFATLLLPFVEQYHFAMISVTTDGQPIIGLPTPKSIAMQRLASRLPLASNYLPALFLVNLTTNTMQPLSYGFMALSDLKTRFLDVLTHFARYSFSGLGERTQ